MNEEVDSISGGLFMEEVKLKSGKTLKADGIFVAVGTIPFTKIIDHLGPQKDEEGCLVVDKRQETTVK